MTAQGRYKTAADFRTALERRLRTESQATGIPVDRLRKEAAFHRLLVRFQVVSSDKWALKGGMALIARLGEQVRATKDADVNCVRTGLNFEIATTRFAGQTSLLPSVRSGSFGTPALTSGWWATSPSFSRTSSHN